MWKLYLNCTNLQYIYKMEFLFLLKEYNRLDSYHKQSKYRHLSDMYVKFKDCIYVGFYKNNHFATKYINFLSQLYRNCFECWTITANFICAAGQRISLSLFFFGSSL